MSTLGPEGTSTSTASLMVPVPGLPPDAPVMLTDTRANEFVQKIEAIKKHYERMFKDVGQLLSAHASANRRSLRLAEHMKQYSVAETPAIKQALGTLSDAIRQVTTNHRLFCGHCACFLCLALLQILTYACCRLRTIVTHFMITQ